MKKLGILTVIIQLLCMTSCLTTKDTNLLREPGGEIPVYPREDIIGEYKIKTGDELLISISFTSGTNNKSEQLFSLYSSRSNTSVTESGNLKSTSVQPDGTIYFPYLGNIPVEGKTTLEVRKILEDDLNNKIIKGCLVQVTLKNRFFSVIGESNAGRYPIAKEQMTIYQALSMSQDIFPYGDRTKVKILRQTENGTIIKTFDLRSQDVVNSEFYYIQPNDVIYIKPMSKQFWGIDSFGAFFAVVSTVASLGLLIYGLVK